MMRHCDGNDPNLIRQDEETEKFVPCTCDARFDDVNFSVIYPHVKLLTEAEKAQIREILQTSMPEGVLKDALRQAMEEPDTSVRQAMEGPRKEE